MIKVTLLIGSFVILATAAVLKTSVDPKIKMGCKSETELWGSEDGTKFYFCLGNDQSYEEACPPNTFFVNNATVSGCIPVEKVSDECVYHTEPQPCEGKYIYQPQPHPDPTKFYFCPAKGAKPVLTNCGDRGAFINQDGWLGCLEWVRWRQLRGCNSTE